VRFEEEAIDGAEIVVVSYGITARVARMGIAMAREKGVQVGVLSLTVVWPFPEKRIRELAGAIKAFVVPEINFGQMVLEVERAAGGRCAAVPVPHPGGGVHDPRKICEAILRAAQ
jgi:2-oxoglutarate ferredoxin oxidoreductase subunit alpha